MNYKQLKKDFHHHSFKASHVYPKLEDIQVNVSYAFSVNPCNQRDSVIETCSEHKVIFDLLKDYCSYKLYPEISTKSQLLHYHGYLNFKRYIEIGMFYKYCIPKLRDLATFTIEPITSYDWYIYVRKQRHIMEPLMALMEQTYKYKHLRSAVFVNLKNHKHHPPNAPKHSPSTHDLDA